MGAEVVPGEAAELQLAFEAAADRVTPSRLTSQRVRQQQWRQRAMT